MLTPCKSCAKSPELCAVCVVCCVQCVVCSVCLSGARVCTINAGIGAIKSVTSNSLDNWRLATGEEETSLSHDSDRASHLSSWCCCSWACKTHSHLLPKLCSSHLQLWPAMVGKPKIYLHPVSSYRRYPPYRPSDLTARQTKRPSNRTTSLPNRLGQDGQVE